MVFRKLIPNLGNLNRLREILTVFAEYGLGFYVRQSKLSKHITFSKRITTSLKKAEDIPNPVRIRLAFEALGPSFIKLAQIISLRPDLIPFEYIKELEKTQDKVPPFPFSEVKKIIEKECKVKTIDLFKHIDPKPIASASLSQVHKAILKNGRVVALKVKRPNIEELIKNDIKLLYYIADNLEKHTSLFKQYPATKIIREYERWTLRELNFLYEMSNMNIVRNNFKNEIIIPETYNKYCTENILVMEYVEGTSLHNLNLPKKQTKEVMHNVYKTLLKMLFEHGFFHADPHPGNILVDKHNKLIFLDFGIVGTFTDSLRRKSLQLLLSIIDNDLDTAYDIFMDMGLVRNIDKLHFQRDLKLILDQVRYIELENIKISYILQDTLNLAMKYQIKLPVDFILYGKTIITLEGIGLRYSPDLNIVEEATPQLKKIMKKEFSINRVRKSLTRGLQQYNRLFEKIPNYTLETLERLKSGDFSFDINDTDIGNISKELEHASGNLSIGLMIAGTIVGSALIASLNITPVYQGIPLLSIVGFSISLLLGLWLVKRTVFLREIKL